jgi:hypothetical protein
MEDIAVKAEPYAVVKVDEAELGAQEHAWLAVE